MRFVKNGGWLVCLAIAAITSPAYALDVSQILPAQPIGDSQLTIGARTLQLPQGQWHLVAGVKGETTNPQSGVPAETQMVYALNTKGRQFKTGVVLRMPVDGVPVRQWIDDPCKVSGHIYRAELDNSKTPECLVVFKWKSHLNKPSGNFYPQALEWIQKENIKLPGPVYEIAYTKLAANDFGTVRLFVPVPDVASDDDIVNWAKGLPVALKRFFEKRETLASLPALPERSAN